MSDDKSPKPQHNQPIKVDQAKVIKVQVDTLKKSLDSIPLGRPQINKDKE